MQNVEFEGSQHPEFMYVSRPVLRDHGSCEASRTYALRGSLTCALWSRQGCRRKARRGNMAVCLRATREHVFHVVP